MTATPPAHAPPTKAEKPTLTGSRIKQRKGVVKSQAKFEPEVFRDQLLKFFEQVPDHDYEGLLNALDKAGNTLDYRKYTDQFFEIFITGGLLAPGGSYLDENVPLTKFSIFEAKSADIDHVKPFVSTLEKLIRRYKFLQKPLEESNLAGIIQYTSRFTPEQRKKLAIATAVMIQIQLVSASVLLTLQKDHLVKDDVAIAFIDVVFRTYLGSENSMDQLGSALRKGGIKEPLLFFPQTRRSQPGLVASHFRGEGLNQVADYFQKRAAKEARDGTVARLRDMRGGQVEEVEKSSDEDVIDFLREQRERSGIALEEFAPIVWEGLMNSVDWSQRQDQIEAQALKEVKSISPILEPFCPNSKCELALINTIQIHCYDDARLMKTFPNILKVLYNEDVITDQAILYWAQKGAKPQGKAQFLKATEPLVKFLEEQSDDEEE
ncbi:hypothetical protein CBS101457_001347 [Exobasidium rhododendri]|nr:hypothetical protein CBS101457_001347 [Exobasidium rhododendri]